MNFGFIINSSKYSFWGITAGCVSSCSVRDKLIFDVERLTIIKSLVHLNTNFELYPETNW